MSITEEETVVSVGQKHELMDRSHCLNIMFEELVADHPAAAGVTLEIEAVREAINNLYQAAGTQHNDHKDG